MGIGERFRKLFVKAEDEHEEMFRELQETEITKWKMQEIGRKISTPNAHSYGTFHQQVAQTYSQRPTYHYNGSFVFDQLRSTWYSGTFEINGPEQPRVSDEIRERGRPYLKNLPPSAQEIGLSLLH